MKGKLFLSLSSLSSSSSLSASFLFSAAQKAFPAPRRDPLPTSNHGLCDDPGAHARRARQRRGRQGLRVPVRLSGEAEAEFETSNFD